MADLRQLVEAVNTLRYLLAHGDELLEAKLLEISERLSAAAKAGLLNDLTVLGPVAAEGPGLFSVNADQVVQMVFLGQRGVGVLLWNSHDFLAAQKPDLPERPAELSFVSLESCSPLIRAILVPALTDMLERIEEEIRSRTRPQEGA